MADTRGAGDVEESVVEIRRAGADDLDNAIGLLRRFFSEGGARRGFDVIGETVLARRLE